jgi:hypothetical protein
VNLEEKSHEVLVKAVQYKERAETEIKRLQAENQTLEGRCLRYEANMQILASDSERLRNERDEAVAHVEGLSERITWHVRNDVRMLDERTEQLQAEVVKALHLLQRRVNAALAVLPQMRAQASRGVNGADLDAQLRERDTLATLNEVERRMAEAALGEEK